MARAVLDQVLEMLDKLGPDELRRVDEVIQERLMPQTDAEARKAFFQALLASGLLQRIKAPPRGGTVEPPPVPIRGKPLSETIIEERR